MKLLFLVLSLGLAGPLSALEAGVTLTGETRTWHKLTLVCPGPATTETATPNPFVDYRFNAVFNHPDSGKTYTVPGYYAADGNAAESSATGGNVWHVHFSPDEAGTWNYTLSFRQGAGIAVDPNPAAGSPAGHFDGISGTFEILPTDKTGSDLRGKGRLEYVGKHHLRFAGTGEYFMKCGTDSPENLLAYDDFDGTPNAGNRRKTWAAHAADHDASEAAEYAWGTKGTELLGAVRYLSSQGLNAFSFLTFSLDGDDDNIFPHLLNAAESFGTSGTDNRWGGNKVHHQRFDVSKLAQWERVFAYATTKGMYLHFKTQEVENGELMDDPSNGIGTERKLYYRELVARFGHHLALNWNLGEENSNSEAQRKAFAQWFHDNDPYRHPVVMHTYDSNQGAYNALLGAGSKLTGVSLQPNDDAAFATVFPECLEWVQKSASIGKPWVVACDEPGNSSEGLRSGSGQPANHASARKNALWGNPMAGGGGVEWYFGNDSNNPANGDLSCQDFRSREAFWPICRNMLAFWKSNAVPFWDMANADPLITHAGDHCLAKPGEHYVIHLRSGGSTSLNLTAFPEPFSIAWYDPVNGGSLQAGSVTQVVGGSPVSVGSPPANPSADWIVLVRKVTSNTPPQFAGTSLATDYATAATVSKNKLLFAASDAEGDALSISAAGPSSARGGTVTLGASIVYTPAAGFSGKDVFPVTIRDSQNATTTGLVTVIVGPPSTGGVAGGNPPAVSLSNGLVTLRFHGIPGVTYTIQRSVDLVSWQTIHTAAANEIGILDHTDAAPLSPNGFYRLNTP